MEKEIWISSESFWKRFIAFCGYSIIFNIISYFVIVLLFFILGV